MTLFKQIKSPRIQELAPILNKKASDATFDSKEELNYIFNFAIKNKYVEILEELVDLKVDFNIIIDSIWGYTPLAILIQQPYYHSLFVRMIESGAKTYCKHESGQEYFSSNALHLSVRFEEFLNINYLIEKKECTMLEALTNCYYQNKIHILQFFLEIASKEDILKFKEYAEHSTEDKRIKALDIIEDILRDQKNNL